jgi:hypothetical protein
VIFHRVEMFYTRKNSKTICSSETISSRIFGILQTHLSFMRFSGPYIIVTQSSERA